jgi:hypothetical protein
LDELSDKIAVCREGKDSLSLTEGRFDPLREIYNTLSKFEVTVKDDEVQMLNSLDTAFEDFATFLSDSEVCNSLYAINMPYAVCRMPYAICHMPYNFTTLQLCIKPTSTFYYPLPPTPYPLPPIPYHLYPTRKSWISPR